LAQISDFCSSSCCRKSDSFVFSAAKFFKVTHGTDAKAAAQY
jgi:hypothetical protein